MQCGVLDGIPDQDKDTGSKLRKREQNPDFSASHSVNAAASVVKDAPQSRKRLTQGETRHGHSFCMTSVTLKLFWKEVSLKKREQTCCSCWEITGGTEANVRGRGWCRALDLKNQWEQKKVPRWPSRLRNEPCHCCGAGSIPGLGIPHVVGRAEGRKEGRNTGWTSEPMNRQEHWWGCKSGRWNQEHVYMAFLSLGGRTKWRQRYSYYPTFTPIFVKTCSWGGGRTGNYEGAGICTFAFGEDAKLQTYCSITVHGKSKCLSSLQVLSVFGRKKMALNSMLPTASWKNYFSNPKQEKNLHKHNCLY